MEARLAQFAAEHLPQLAAEKSPFADGVQVLLRALPGVDASMPASAVFSVDWYRPTASDHASADPPGDAAGPAHTQRLVQQRESAEIDCLAALLTTPGLLGQFTGLLEVTRRYTLIREEQAGTLTLGWPLLRACALRLGQTSVEAGSLTQAQA